MLRWVSGTIFGREVVPDVCRISATSSASAEPRAAAGGVPAPPQSRNAPAPAVGLGHERDQRDAELLRRLRRAGESLPCLDDQRLGVEIGQVEVELVGLDRPG